MKRTPANSCFWYWYVIQWFLACKNNYLVKIFSRDITKLHKRGKYADQILLSYVSENTYIYFWHAYIFLICIYFRHPYIFLIRIYFWHAYNPEMHIFLKINKYIHEKNFNMNFATNEQLTISVKNSQFEACIFIKKRLQLGYFPVNFVKFLWTLILKKICEPMFLDINNINKMLITRTAEYLYVYLWIPN